MSITSLAVKRAVTFAMVFVAVLGFGLVSLSRLSPELLPDVTFPIASVSATYSGVGPEDIENLITRPIEGAVATVTHVKEVSSTVREGGSSTMVEFDWGTDMDVAAADIREKIDLVERLLPEDIDKPRVFKFDPTMMPIMFITVSGERSTAELRKLAEDQIKPRLERVEGVAAVSVFGGLNREIQVHLNRRRMEAYGLSTDKVVGAISSGNLDLPGGSVTQAGREYTVRTTGAFESVGEVKDVVVTYADGAPVRLKDMARIEDGFEEQTSLTKVEGKPGVMLQIQKQSGAITVDVSDRVKAELSRIGDILPQGVHISVRMDQAEYINKSVRQIVNVAIQGGILAVLILFLFLHNVRGTAIIAVVLPMSIIATFVAMDASNLTLNMMSMGGLALAIGLLVDNAIVVLENTFRHREEGEGMREAAIFGTAEVATPIVASTLTTVSVFLPVIFVPGVVGMMFRDFSLTVTVSLLVSLVVALTLVPLLCSRFLKLREEMRRARLSWLDRLSDRIGGWLQQLDILYQEVLGWCLDHRKQVLPAVGGVFVLSLLMVYPLRLVGTEFVPRGDEGRIRINVELPPGTKLEQTEKVVDTVEQTVLESVPELEGMHSRAGAGTGRRMRGGGSHTGRVSLELVDLAERKRSQGEIIRSLRPKLGKIPGARIRFSAGGGGLRFGSTESPISVEIYGYDLEQAEQLAGAVKDLLERTPGTSDVETSLEEPRPEFNIRIDRAKASSLGLAVETIANAIDWNVRGTVAGLFREGGDEYNILVRLREEDREGFEDLLDMPLSTPQGGTIRLRNIAWIEPALGPLKIERKGQQRLVTVTADYAGRDLGSLTREIEEGISRLQLPAEFSIQMGGEAKEQRESFLWLALALIGAVLLVYMVMASLFESLLDPFIIMFTFPLAIIGVVWFFFFTGTIFSVIAFIGLIMLSGIVVNNGIVMVDYINLLRARGLELREAVILGGRRRIRPVLMTALTTIFAMTPMAFGIGEGAELRAPMARAVVGGLTLGTLLTLLLVPVIYSVFETVALGVQRRKQHAEHSA